MVSSRCLFRLGFDDILAAEDDVLQGVTFQKVTDTTYSNSPSFSCHGSVLLVIALRCFCCSELVLGESNPHPIACDGASPTKDGDRNLQS